MAKVIKLNEKDIQKLVEGIIKEGNDSWVLDDMNTNITPEEMGADDYEAQQSYQNGEFDDEEETSGPEVELQLAKDEEGNFYVFKKGDNGENDRLVLSTPKK